MAAIATQGVECPACGVRVDVPLNADLGRAEHGSVKLTLTPDMALLREHLVTHQ